ncbi:uncharacterized protein [Primulina huaijiensis]|uniref:uncharacterized protein isoform X1 n=1 Tax=Primulina huaijiensis TaxID=1492673 RepID=UPI003CC78A03
MCDGWSTRNKHPIINFMIYCDRNMVFHSSVDCSNKTKTADFILSLLNKVIDEIGEENVVQVVTDSEGANKAAGAKLMMERPHLFWSPCAAHCLDLILEDVGKMEKVKKCIEKAKQITSFIYNSDKLVNLMKTFTNDRELLRPGITRFATEFISIESLVRHTSDLKRLCTSAEWEEINNTSRRRKIAEKTVNIIMDARFWKRARDVCAAMEPLVKVLKLVDQDKKPTMSIIYEAMDRAKLAIKENTKDWQSYWDVIDNRWYNQLHQHLHAAAYFLNPLLQYSGTCVYTDEVKRGLKVVIKRLEPDLSAQASAMSEIKLFTDQTGEFGSPLAKMAVKKSLPGLVFFKRIYNLQNVYKIIFFVSAEWWNDYGDDAPHLRKIAIKILSQTCSSSGCERNWSTWSLVHTKLRNRLAVEKLHKLVYVHYNMRLRVRNLTCRKEEDDYYSPIDLNHIFHDDDILSEWIRDNEPPVLQDDDLAWLDEGIQELHSDEHNTTTNGQSRAKKNKNVQKSTKSKEIRILSRDDGEDSDDSDDGNDQQGLGKHHRSQDTTHDQSRHDDHHIQGMTWAEGDENYYATQDTDHGYRPGIEEQRRFLASLSEFSSASDKEHSAGSSRPYMGVEEHIRCLGLGGNRKIQMRDNYGSMSYNLDSQHVGYDPIGNQSSGYGYYGNYSARHDSFDTSTSDTSGIRHRGFDYGSSHYIGDRYNESESYFDGARNRFPNHSSSIRSGFGCRGPEYGSSSTAASSSGYRGFGYYSRRDETLLQSHSSHSNDHSSTQSNQYPY